MSDRHSCMECDHGVPVGYGAECSRCANEEIEALRAALAESEAKRKEIEEAADSWRLAAVALALPCEALVMVEEDAHTNGRITLLSREVFETMRAALVNIRQRIALLPPPAAEEPKP